MNTKTYINTLCTKILKPGKKTPSLRLAKSGKAQFTCVNEHFIDERNEEIGVFLQALNKKKIIIPALLILCIGLFSSVLNAQTGNTALGTGAGASNTTGDNNTFVGDSAGTLNTTGNSNIYLGKNAGRNSISPDYSVFIGYGAGHTVDNDADNVFIGYMSGYFNSNSDGTFIGHKSGYNNTSGYDNTFIGEEAGYNNTTGKDNVFIGEDAGGHIGTGRYNTAVGNQAMGSRNFNDNFGSYQNTAVGNEALYDVGSHGNGHRNTAVGDSAGIDNGAGNYNTFIGQASGAANEYADFNTFIGCRAGYDNNRWNGQNNANRNTYVGYRTGFTNRNGEDNVGMGYKANFGNTVMYRNTFIGSDAFVNNHDITSIGYDTYSTGQYSCLIGSKTDTRSTGAIAMGYMANITTSSNYSIAIGYQADVDDENNIAIGYQAGIGAGGNTSNYNIAIGYGASIDSTYSIGIGNDVSIHASNAIAIGNTVAATGNNSIAIGNSISVSNDNEVVIGNSASSVIGGSVNWTATSDGRFKSGVEENVVGLDLINKLRPVTYQMDHEKIYAFYGAEIPAYLKPALEAKSQVRYSGFIAQEVEEQARAVGYDFSGVKAPENKQDAYGLRYAEFVAPLVKSNQELYDIIESQQQIIAQYEDAIRAVTQRVEAMEDQISTKANKIFANKKYSPGVYEAD